MQRLRHPSNIDGKQRRRGVFAPLRIIGVWCSVSLFLLMGFGFFWPHSYPLQDGYRLQGIRGHGKIYRGVFDQVIPLEIDLVQGSRNGFIHGSVTGNDPSNYFILNTKTGRIEWLDASAYYPKVRAYGCPNAEMNKGVNLAGLTTGEKFIRD